MPFIVTTKRPQDVFKSGDEFEYVGRTGESFLVARCAVATLEERIVFDSKEWKAAGYDQPEGNERFWHHALILESEPSSGLRHDKVATVLFLHDGRVSRGHFLNSMNSIEAADRLVPETGGTVGPLPDGTVIEVEPTTNAALFEALDARTRILLVCDEDTSEVCAAYNARQEAQDA